MIKKIAITIISSLLLTIPAYAKEPVQTCWQGTNTVNEFLEIESSSIEEFAPGYSYITGTFKTSDCSWNISGLLGGDYYTQVAYINSQHNIQCPDFNMICRFTSYFASCYYQVNNNTKFEILSKINCE